MDRGALGTAVAAGGDQAHFAGEAGVIFEIGRDYRVHLTRGTDQVTKVGELLDYEGHLIILKVKGIETIFHLGSGQIAYIERVDEAAEKARTDAYVESWKAGL